MRKFILLLAIAAISSATVAQIKSHAIGLRFGGSNSAGAEISYQHGLSKKNRLEADLGIHSSKYHSAFALTGIYQWVWPIQDGFSWYAGFGGQIGSWSYKSEYKDDYDDDGGFWLAAMGQVGIQYQFDIPLQLSLDIRPGIGLINAYDDLDIDLGLGIRYTF